MTIDPHRAGGTPRARPLARLVGALAVGAGLAAVALPPAVEATGALDFFRHDARTAPNRAAPGILPGLFGAPQRAALPPPGDPSQRVRPGAPASRAGPARSRGTQSASANRRTICVRMCDGYFFPVGDLASRRDLPLHDLACNTGCPGAPTKIFVMARGSDDIGAAEAADGMRYADLPMANAYTSSIDRTCSCQGPNRRVADRLDIRRDHTLRPGDIIVTSRGPLVYDGAPGAPEDLADFEPFAEARVASALREKADERLGVSFREEMEAHFRATHTPMGGLDLAGLEAERAAAPGERPVRRVDVFDIPATGAIDR